MAGSDKGISAPTLIVTGGPHDGQTLVLESGTQVVLGSGAATALPLQLGNVAPEHAHLAWAGHALRLSDLGSPTGTYVNGERIDAEHPLADGDRVCLGPPGSRQSVKLLVRLPESAPGPLVFEEPALPDFRTGAASAPGSGGLDLNLPGTLETPHAGTPRAEPPPHPEAPLRLVEPARGSSPAVRRTAEGVTATASDEQAGSQPKLTAPPGPEAPRSERRPRPDYTSEMPSVLPDRPREPLAVPASPRAGLPSPTLRGLTPPRARGLRLGTFDVPPVALKAAAGVGVLALVLLGLRVFLRPAPTIRELTPPKAEPGGTITIVGRDFAASASGNVVRFGDQPGKVKSATDERLTVEVPGLDVSKGPIEVPVTVRSHGRTSQAAKLQLYSSPSIRALEPDLALPGAEVALVLAAPVGKQVEVFVNGQAAEVLENVGARLRIRVPQLNASAGAKARVTVQSTGESSLGATLLIGGLPFLAEIQPTAGPAGTFVTLSGRGFAADPGADLVAFAGRRALVVSASPTQLVVAAPPPPSSETQYPAQVTLNVGGSASNALSFTQSRPSSAVFTPRFYPAPLEGDPGRVLVSTELGPLLLLSDRAEAASPAERAARLAQALNLLAEGAQSGRLPVFELRESPQPGVGVQGGATLVSASAADAAGYQAQAKGVAANPRIVAAYWTALLQDYFGLFVAYRRPAAVAEISGRGRVLIDVFADAQRHNAAGSSGVPRGLLVPLAPALARDLRDLALLLPGGAEKGAASVAIEGTWDGSVEESGQEARRVQVTLRRQQGARLGGSLSTRVRSLTMDIPLQDVSYEKGTLRFTLLAGGAPRQFTGTLQGATISGSVNAPGAKQPVGSFTLNFVK